MLSFTKLDDSERGKTYTSRRTIDVYYVKLPRDSVMSDVRYTYYVLLLVIIAG